MNESGISMMWRAATFAVVIVAGGLILWMWISFKRKVAALSAQKLAAQAGPSDASLRDPVTGLYNRKHLLQRLQDNMARCERKKETLALVLWDIDGFVQFNNRFGQDAGDQLLKRVAETIRKTIRGYDEAFRSGPDEFCTILIPGDESVAAEVTQRVSQIVEKSLFENSDYSNQSFSIPWGIVFYPSDSNVPEALLHAAGQALYRSKFSRVPN